MQSEITDNPRDGPGTWESQKSVRLGDFLGFLRGSGGAEHLWQGLWGWATTWLSDTRCV